MNAVIQIDNLTKTYTSGWFTRNKVEALRGVSLSVEPGQVFGILGPNGAGKTTLIKILMGLVRASSGTASIKGIPLGDQNLRRIVGYLPEHHRFPTYLTGAQAIDYYGRLAGLSAAEVRQRQPEVLERVGMIGWENTKVRNYSKGMSQRLGLAQAMIHDPDIYFLDEPTDGVDPVGRAEIRTILQQLSADGKTVFINSHILQEVELICQRVAIMTKGTILKSGSMAEITSHRPQLQMVINKSAKDFWKDLEELFGSDLGDETPGDNCWTFTIPADNQENVDKTVDLLRDKKCSVLAMKPIQISLEDAFIEAVGGRQVGGKKADEQ